VVVGGGSLAVGESELEFDGSFEGFDEKGLKLVDVSIFDPVVDESSGGIEDSTIFTELNRL